MNGINFELLKDFLAKVPAIVVAIGCGFLNDGAGGLSSRLIWLKVAYHGCERSRAVVDYDDENT